MRGDRNYIVKLRPPLDAFAGSRSGQVVSGVPASRQRDHAQEGRHRLGARHIEAHYRNARRQNLGGVAAWPRFYLRIHIAGAR